MEKFCNRLRQLREEADVSMSQLARALEVSNAAVCKWENGVAEPKVSYIIKLADFFDCTVDFLVGKTDDLGAANPTDTSYLKLTYGEKQLIDSFRELNPNMKKLIQQTVDAWKNIDKKDTD